MDDISEKKPPPGDQRPLETAHGSKPGVLVDGWYRTLKSQLERLEPYLVPGRLVTFQQVAPEEKAFYESLAETVTLPRAVCAVFIPPSVVQQAMWPPASGTVKAASSSYSGVAPDAGAVAAQRCGDTSIIVNALFSFPPYAPGIDVYQKGHLLAGYTFQDRDTCAAELSGLLTTYLT
jgi:hypothetical protein